MAKTQWHPAFCAAMRLELKDIPTLQFTNEFNLTEKPLEVDLLIINKPEGVRIDNFIGEFFGEHNLLEYKSPTDHEFNEFAICQALSYAYYYCDRYQTWDVTLSLVVSKSHFNLLKWMDAHGMRYTKRHDGIYTLHDISFLKVQIVVTEELDSATFNWLSALTDNLTEAKAKRLVEATGRFKENEDKRLVQSVMQVLLSANKSVFERIRRDVDMTLMDFLKPEVDKYAQDFARQNDIKHARAMIQHGADNEYIKLIMNMTDEEIDELRKDMQHI